MPASENPKEWWAIIPQSIWTAGHDVLSLPSTNAVLLLLLLLLVPSKNFVMAQFLRGSFITYHWSAGGPQIIHTSGTEPSCSNQEEMNTAKHSKEKGGGRGDVQGRAVYFSLSMEFKGLDPLTPHPTTLLPPLPWPHPNSPPLPWG